MSMVESNQRLLELAAKAIGIELWIEDDGEEFEVFIRERGNKRPQGVRRWDPLDDDAHALRLAVRLDIEMRFHVAAEIPSVTASCKGRDELPVPRERWGTDKEAATRRAIVRAAAEIGRQKRS